MSRSDDESLTSESPLSLCGRGSVSDSGSEDRLVSASLARYIKSPDGRDDVFVVDEDGGETPIQDADFDEIKPLAHGAQGKVYAALVYYRNEKGALLSRRCILKDLSGQRLRGNSPFSKHAILSKKQRSSLDNNILHLIDIIEVDDESYGLMPYSSLLMEELVNRLPDIKLRKYDCYLAIILHVMSDISVALNYMHSLDVVHRDVKIENILFYQGHVCLIDLDCSDDSYSPGRYLVGSPYYMHPSCFYNVANSAHPGNDVYALGRVLKIMLGELNIGLLKKISVREYASQQVQVHESMEDVSKRGGRQCMPKIDRHISVEENLLYIADYLTSTPLSKMPSANELKHYFSQLTEFLSDSIAKEKGGVSLLNRRVKEIYGSLEDTRYFNNAACDCYAARSGRRLSIFSKNEKKEYLPKSLGDNDSPRFGEFGRRSSKTMELPRPANHPNSLFAAMVRQREAMRVPIEPDRIEKLFSIKR